MSPFFSVIIPAYNRGHIIKATLEAIGRQTFSDFEVIIVDDGSTDDTEKIVRSVLSDARFRYHKTGNQGVSAARNTGASLATGQYLVFLDSDDTVESDWLMAFDSELKGGKDIAFCGAVLIFQDGKRVIKEPKQLGPLYAGIVGIYNAGAYAVRRDVFLKAGGFDSSIKFGENYDLGVRLSHRITSHGFTVRPLLLYNKEVKQTKTVLENKITSKKTMLAKYDGYEFLAGKVYSKFEKQTRLSLAVDYLRLGRSREGRITLLQLILAYPFWLRPYLQLVLSYTGRYKSKIHELS